MAERGAKRSQRLQPVVDVAQSREQSNAVRLAVCEHGLQEAEQRLAELRRYHDEYQQNFQQRAKGGLGVRQLQEYQNFMARLRHAIAAQEQACQRLAAERDQQRGVLLTATTRRRALGKLVEHAGKEEARMEARQQQRESDEGALRTRRSNT